MSEAKNVVLVEEDDALREELAQQLRADGHRVITLEDGYELCDYLELVLYSKGKVPFPALIISDVELAGFGGLHICNMLSRAEDAVPIILLAHNEEEGAGVGAVRVLNKSGELGQLHEAILGYLEGRFLH
jgi:DNA-binding response OmpR family regulator